MSENDSRLPDTPSASSQYVGVIVGVGQQITEVSKKFRECHHGNCQRYGRTQINGKHRDDRGRDRDQQTADNSARDVNEAAAQAKRTPIRTERAVTGKRSLTSEEMGRCSHSEVPKLP